MTRQKVDVIPASVRSVQNGGQLKSQTNRKHSTKTSLLGNPAGFLQASMQMKQSLVPTESIVKSSTA